MTDAPIVPVRALLAAALKDRRAFESIKDSSVLDSLNDLPGDLWREIQAYYEKDTESSKAHLELVQAALDQRYSNPKHRTRGREFLASIASEEVAVGACRSYLAAYRRERAGEMLAAALLRRGDPGAQQRALEAYLAACEEPVQAESMDEVDYLGAIKARVPKEGRLRLRLRSLNERLRGGLLPGHSVILVARPNAGKTALAISVAVGFARDGLRVLYVGNEDHVWDLMARAVANITGLVADEIEKDPDAAVAKALELGLGNLTFRQLAPGTLQELEKAIKDLKPQVLIVDQLRNLSTKSDSYTQKLDEVARGVRNLGLKYQVVTISVTQAGDSAEGKATLDMGDVDYSNTGIPGACDVLLMMGVTETLKAAGLRRISLPKNKIGGIEDSFDVKLDPTRSKVTSHT